MKDRAFRSLLAQIEGPLAELTCHANAAYWAATAAGTDANMRALEERRTAVSRFLADRAAFQELAALRQSGPLSEPLLQRPVQHSALRLLVQHLVA